MNARSAWFLSLGLTLGSVWAGSVSAHALFTTPRPRDQQDGYKDPPRAPPGTGAPCGVARAASQPLTNYTPGMPLTVQWTETVTHPGCFVIDFALENDQNFQVLGVKSHQGAAGGTPRQWSLAITLPSTPCTNCTLRLRQLMLSSDVADSACPPANIPQGATYYSCANITLGGGGGTGGSTSTGGATSGGTTSGGAPAGGSTSAGAGGTTGMAGTSTTGGTHTAGATTTAGAPSTGAGTTGASGASGAAPGTGGATSGGSATSGAGNDPGMEDDGGGCSFSANGSGSAASFAALLLAGVAAFRRRRHTS